MSILRPTKYQPRRPSGALVSFVTEGGLNQYIGRSGIYVLTFGTKSYVGHSKNISNRVKDHRTIINSLILKGIAGRYPTNYRNIMAHLNENPNILEVIVTVPEVDVKEKLLRKREDVWIEKYRKRSRCLNAYKAIKV